MQNAWPSLAIPAWGKQLCGLEPRTSGLPW